MPRAPAVRLAVTAGAESDPYDSEAPRPEGWPGRFSLYFDEIMREAEPAVIVPPPLTTWTHGGSGQTWVWTPETGARRI